MVEINIQKRLQFAEGDGLLEINKTIDEKDFLVLFGNSGVGKTTILRIIAGLTEPDEGVLRVHGITWFDRSRKINLPPQKRNIGLVFQDYALFPNMTVWENLLFAQRKTDQQFLREIISLLALEGLEKRKPEHLSGGQKQRTALARAIAQKPDILLLDEPLSALDKDTRTDLQMKLGAIHQRFNLTSILVSHDLAEIARLGTKIWMIKAGKVEEDGEPMAIFSKGKVSGKVQIIGEVIQIRKEDVVYVVTVVSGNNFVKVIATEDDVKPLQVGDQVMIASKAFNPLIIKI